MIEINPKTDMLLVVDVQLDFTGYIDENNLAAGSLAVADAPEIIPVINKYIQKIPRKAFSRDMHPAGHSSFIGQGGLWPDHCVIGTRGAEFDPGLDLDEQRAFIISKGTEIDKDAYSAFDGTGFEMVLPGMGIKRLFICGLATDYCVKATVLDALKIKGISVYVLTDAIKAVDVNPGDGKKALQEMFDAGAWPLVLAEVK
jgi:nicotinamidase/pyrazinamidase